MKVSTPKPPAGWQQRLRGIVMGGSAGSLDALSVLLPALPASLAVPVLVVVHLPRERPSLLAEIFRARCALDLREAVDKEPALPGTVYFAPPDYHLLLDLPLDVDGVARSGPALALSVDAPVFYSRPAIDVLFESAADVLGPGLLGVVLSGGNEDGARGLECIARAGGVTMVQTPSDAKVRAMPDAALARGPVHYRLAVAEMAALLASLGTGAPAVGVAAGRTAVAGTQGHAA